MQVVNSTDLEPTALVHEGKCRFVMLYWTDEEANGEWESKVYDNPSVADAMGAQQAMMAETGDWHYFFEGVHPLGPDTDDSSIYWMQILKGS
jgi:hypothetical protein